MPSKSWDIEEVVERRKGTRFRTTVCSAAKAVVFVGLAAALQPLPVRAISAATVDYTVIGCKWQALPEQIRGKRTERGEFDPDVQLGMSTVRLGKTIPSYFRVTDPEEVDDIDLPPL